MLTALAGAIVTLGVMIWFAIRDARLTAAQPLDTPTPASLSLGDVQGLDDADVIFPLERYVLNGEAQWLPLVLALDSPDFLADDKRACLSHLAAASEDTNCPVEYAFQLDVRNGRVLGVQALVLSGETSPCRAYVECRLPGLAKAPFDIPESERLRHPAGLQIVDKVTHATRLPSAADEAREVAQLRERLATPDPPELLRMPAEAQRLSHFLRQRSHQRLEALQLRGETRG